MVYRPLKEAKKWLGKRRHRDLTGNLGGVLDPGFHRDCIVLESKLIPPRSYRLTIGYEDGPVIEQDFSYSQARQLQLGTKLDIVVKKSKGGYSIIVDSERTYKLIRTKDRQLEAKSTKIQDLKRIARAKGFQLTTNFIIKWTVKHES